MSLWMETNDQMLRRLFSSDYPGERVIGTYLYPPRVFGSPDWNNPVSLAEVIKRITLGKDSTEILVTRNGGLFVEPPAHLVDPYRGGDIAGFSDFEDKLTYQYKVTKLFNQLICELALLGLVSEPATPVHVSHGKLLENHAIIRGVSGGREIYLERTLTPILEMIRPGTWIGFPHHSVEILHQAGRQCCTSKLVQISESIPELLAGAYYFYSRHLLSEAINDAWIVIEQIIDYLWVEYVSKITDQISDPRRVRLEDPRTYTVAVRLEVLLTAGKISRALYDHLNKARKRRNDLAHRARVSPEAASECMHALQMAVEHICGRSVEPAMVHRGISW